MDTINDIFGNEIKVTSITGALLQSAQMLAMCDKMGGDDPVQWIDEYEIKLSTDNRGNQFGYSVKTNSGKYVSIKEFHQHNDNELKKLLQSKQS